MFDLAAAKRLVQYGIDQEIKQGRRHEQAYVALVYTQGELEQVDSLEGLSDEAVHNIDLLRNTIWAGSTVAYRATIKGTSVFVGLDFEIDEDTTREEVNARIQEALKQAGIDTDTLVEDEH